MSDNVLDGFEHQSADEKIAAFYKRNPPVDRLADKLKELTYIATKMRELGVVCYKDDDIQLQLGPRPITELPVNEDMPEPRGIKARREGK